MTAELGSGREPAAKSLCYRCLITLCAASDTAESLSYSHETCLKLS